MKEKKRTNINKLIRRSQELLDGEASRTISENEKKELENVKIKLKKHHEEEFRKSEKFYDQFDKKLDKEKAKSYGLNIKLMNLCSNIFKRSLKKCFDAEELRGLENLLELTDEFKDHLNDYKKEIIGMASKNKSYKLLKEKFNKALKYYEQARKELCYFVTTRKPRGQE